MNLFIFRRDIRLYDNIGFNYVLGKYTNIVPVFIFTPEQISSKNKYKSNNAIQFMYESLIDINDELKKNNSKLHIFYGTNKQVLKYLYKKIKINSITFNKDYTPYAIERDKNIKDFCDKKNIIINIFEDYLLFNIGKLNKINGEPYSIFTPFYNNAVKYKPIKPVYVKLKNLVKLNIGETFKDYKINKNILVNGSREKGIKMLNSAMNIKYNITNTTLLSSYIKFGNVSIREVYYKLINKKNIIRQLYWREFFYYITYYFGYVLNRKNFKKSFNKFKWNTFNKTIFEKWKTGNTGIPVVDAGMRQLNKTGYMYNRYRLITSNFLCKLLKINWIYGEQYFASKLIDYDPSVNNGNWQWIAGSGVDTSQYDRRIFNPWNQSVKYDKNCDYIKKWIPELKDVTNKHIHKWNKYYSLYSSINYNPPMLDYDITKKKVINDYIKYKKTN